jgi:chromosomal replication initiation ATPase DnaA
VGHNRPAWDRPACDGYMSQLAFDLPRQQSFSRADYFVSDANAAALAWIDRWPEWPSPVLILLGAPGAGKTHLAHLWCERAAATLIAGGSLGRAHVERFIERSVTGIAVDDADQAPDIALLHLFNACVEVRGHLLLTSRQLPGSWRPGFPDLSSRLRAVPAVGIEPPDDALLGAVLVKHFADRQVRVGPQVIAYLVSHMDRSLAAAAEIAAQLDHAALVRQSAITIPMAAGVLAAHANQWSSPNSEAGVT